MSFSRESSSKSKFNFGQEEIHTDNHTATIKELIAEINGEIQKQEASGIEISITNLERTLNFIGALTGKTYSSIVEPLPYSFLKTVKLLYLCNREVGDHIFEYLGLPEPGGNKPTFEFRLSGRSPRNETKMQLVLELVAQLEKGISEGRRNHIKGFLLTYSKLLECIGIENDEILAPVRSLPPEFHANGTAAIARLAGHISSVKAYSALATRPVNELLYTRILSLPFLHYVGEYQTLAVLAALDFIPQADDHAIRELSQSLDEANVAPYSTHYTSIAAYPDFFEKHATALVKIVSTITALPIQKRDLARKIDHVQKVLHLHVFIVHGRQPLDARLLTVANVVAAMCTVAHQHKTGTRYEPHWQGKSTKNGSKAHNVLKQLEQNLSIEDLYEEDYVPQGVNRLLFNRFNQFHAWICGDQDRHHAIFAFELARLVGYAQCLVQTNIDDTIHMVGEFNNRCVRTAEHLAHEACVA